MLLATPGCKIKIDRGRTTQYGPFGIKSRQVCVVATQEKSLNLNPGTQWPLTNQYLVAAYPGLLRGPLTSSIETLTNYPLPRNILHRLRSRRYSQALAASRRSAGGAQGNPTTSRQVRFAAALVDVAQPLNSPCLMALVTHARYPSDCPSHRRSLSIQPCTARFGGRIPTILLPLETRAIL